VIYDLVRLKNALIDFYNISGMKTVLYDTELNVIISYPTEMNELCRQVRRSRELTERCIGCDRYGFGLCGRAGGRVIYKCHLGLTEAIAPINDGGRILGYLMLGQVVVKGDGDGIVTRLRALAPRTDVEVGELIAAMGSIEEVSPEKLESAVRIMEICAGYLYTSNMLLPSGGEMKRKLESLVRQRLADPELCLDSIRQELGLSRSALYELCKECFGVGVSDYVRLCRIEHAKRLLIEGDLSVSAIAAACGFIQPNHFTKTFKRLVGVLPKDYRSRSNL
jgi:AraC-like DNA-binding protein